MIHPYLDHFTKNFFTGLQSSECKPFVVEGFQVGLVRPEVMKQLYKYPEVNVYNRINIF